MEGRERVWGGEGGGGGGGKDYVSCACSPLNVMSTGRTSCVLGSAHLEETAR